MKDDPSSFLGAVRQRLCLLAGLLAFSVLTLGPVSAVRAQTIGSSSASDVQVDLAVQVPLLGLTLNLNVGPLASVAGVAPPPYNLTQSTVDALAVLLGSQILSAEVLNVNASSNVPGTPEFAAADANVAEVLLNVLGLVTLDAANPLLGQPIIQSTATVIGPCGGPLTAVGSTNIINAVLGGLLVGNVAVLPNPAPNSVLLDISLPNTILGNLGRIRVILNEQIVGGDGTNNRSLTVNAIHIAIEDIEVSLLGLGLLSLDGDIIIAQSTAALSCAPAPQPQADVSITKIGPPTVLSNGQIAYTVIVTNNSPTTAADTVSVMDTLPPGTTFVSATPPCTHNLGIVTCNLGTLAPGAVVPLTIVVTAPTVTVQTCITNTAVVTSSTIDPGPGPNTATSQTCVNPEPPATADVSITKIGPPTVLSNGQIAYTVTVTNNSPTTAANNVSVMDTLPPGTAFVSATPPCTHLGGIVTCNLVGPLAPGASVILTIVVTAPTVTVQTCITNTAVVTSSTIDPGPGNNTATAGTCVNPSPPPAATADVSITKTDFPDPVLVGQQLTYVLTITNNGPDTAQNVTITDTLPAGVNIESITTNPVTVACVAANLTITCGPIATLASGAPPVTVTIVVRPQTPGQITNTATVSSAQTVPDPNTTNNTATTTTTVNPNRFADPDMSVTIADSPDPVLVGNNLTYTLTVANGGPIDSSGSTVTDVLPINTVFVSAAPNCTQASGIVTCNLGPLAVGASTPITIVVTPTAPGMVTNFAIVVGNEVDDVFSNDTATAMTTVNPGGTPPPPVPGPGPDLGGFWSGLNVRCKAVQAEFKCKVKGGFSVQNLGTVNASSSSVSFFLSADSVLDNSDIPLTQKFVKALKVGKTKKIKLKTTLLGDVPSGMSVIAVIAGGGDVNPANNVVSSGPLP